MNDQAIRERALDPARSFIVQAPAGSGKTALLMQRFLVLLSTVQVPEECLAITFTRKAAFEMRDRILAALMRAQDPNPPEDIYTYKIWHLAKKILERSEHLEWDLLANANRLKIQTIDALCASLTRGMPILSRLGSSPEVTEEASALYLTAAKNLLESLEKEDAWSDAVRSLVFHLDNNLSLTQRLLADLLPNRDQWLPYIGRTQNEAEWRAILESGLQSAIAEALGALHEVLPPEPLMNELKALAIFAANQLAYSEAKTAKSEEKEAEILYWLRISDLLLTEEGTWRKTLTQRQGFPAPSSADNKIDKENYKNKKDQMLVLLTSLEAYPEFQARLYALKNCPPPVYTEEQWVLVKALIQLLPILAAHLNIVFQEKGQVDFTEVSLAANRALGDAEAPTDLALVLDNKIRHILVDEFQDTSIAQFGLLEKLTTGWMPGDGRTLFLVGDPMQSIYRFRQAEVGLFLAVKKQGINQLPIEALTLSVNFRSDARIINWLNTVFTDAFPKEDDISSGAICFSPSRAHQNLGGAIEPTVLLMPEHEQESLEEAKAIVTLIQKTKSQDPKGSIAILVRSRTHLSEILALLRQEGIEYQGLDLELLINRPVIQDLMALTQALLHLGDRLAWLSILRCPWINLCLADILLLAQTAGPMPIWGALNRYASLEGLSFSAQSTLARCVPILKQSLMTRDRAHLRTWIWDTWVALKGHECLYEKHSVQDADMYFEMLDKLEQQDSFREPGVLKEKMERLYAKAHTSDPLAIQIMTIHKAKGLEFDTVILPGLGRQPKAPDSPLLLWEERATQQTSHYLIFAPIKAVAEKQDSVYQYLKKQKQKAEHYEALRLLYVAATRAKKHLHCFGHQPLPNSLLSLLLPSLKSDFISKGDTTESLDYDCV